MPNSGKFDNQEEQYPLIQPQSYANPYLEPAELQAAMEADNQPGPMTDADMANATGRILDKGQKGTAQSIGETVEDAKKVAGSVIKKEETTDSTPMWLPIAVVGGFLLFDVGKLLMEKKGTMDTTINIGLMQNLICILNIVVAGGWTMMSMGPATGIAAMFEWEKLKGYAMPSIFFAGGQLFNLLQNLYLDSSTRKVFAQLRIPLTALFGKFVMGQGYTVLQWVMIVSITIAVFQFSFMTSKEQDIFAGEGVMIGLIFSIISNLCAVLGSLAGEKSMKKNKSLPFYLQKFQLEVWTFIFGLVGAFMISPGTGIFIDWGQGAWGVNKSMVEDMWNAPKFTGNWPISYGTAHMTYSTVSLSNIPFTAEYEVVGGVESEYFPNKFDLGDWETSNDLRVQQVVEKAGATAAKFESESVAKFESYKYGKLADVIDKFVAVQEKRYEEKALAGKTMNMEFRDNFVDPGLNPITGRLSAHHEGQYRKWGDVILNTAFYTSAPFARATKKCMGREIEKNFVMVMGTEDNNKKFVPLRLFSRHSPHTPSLVMTENRAGQFVANPDKIKGAGQFDTYFTRSKPTTQGDFEIEGPVAKEATRIMKKNLSKCGDNMKDLAWSERQTYQRFVKTEADIVTLIYQRNVEVVQKAAHGNDRNEVCTVAATRSRRVKITLKCEERELHHVAELTSKRNDCAVKSVQNYKWSHTADGHPNAYKVGGVKNVSEEARKKNSPLQKYKEEKEKGAKRAGEALQAFKDLEVDAAGKEVLVEEEGKLDAPFDEVHDGDWPQEDSNKDEKFHKLLETTKAQLSVNKKIIVWTYPGKMAAGTPAHGGKSKVCNYDMCHMSEDQWNSNIAPFMDFTYNIYYGIKSADEKAKVENDPFHFAEFVGYTRNPMPWFFVSKIWFLAAVIANAGQSWMSAYLSKILSSLWKNICAAIALTLVVILEKLLMSTPQDKARTDWARVIVATLGVISTVFVFQLAPKAPKPEPKKDIESGGGSKH